MIQGGKIKRIFKQCQFLKNYSVREMSSESLPHQEPQQVAGFITKTFQILNNDEFCKICFWSPSGSEFVIKDINKFQQIVLPRYFRHNKMNSFIRQLNMYGFHKSRKQNSKSVFSHPSFLRGRQDLLITIKRKIKGKSITNINVLDTPTQKRKEFNAEAPTADKGSDPLPKEVQSSKMATFTEVNSSFRHLIQNKEGLFSRLNLNISLNKISHNDIAEMMMNDDEENESDDDCVSLAEKMPQSTYKQNRIEKGAESYKFMNPSCFFESLKNVKEN